MFKKLLVLFCLFVISGSAIGLSLSFFKILSNRYIEFGVGRLLFITIQDHWNRWFQLSVILFAASVLILFVFWSLWRFFLSRKIESRYSNAPIFYLYIVATMIFFAAGFGMNKLWLPHKFSKMSILADINLLVAILIGAWFVIRIFLKNSPTVSRRLFKIGIGSFCILVLFNLGMWIEDKKTVPQRMNVVWILIDTLRADHLGCYGYKRNTSPFIDRFAQQSILFKNSFSQESYTLASAASYFTSTYPFYHKVLTNEPTSDILDDRFMTLAEILSAEGYRTAGFLVSPQLKRAHNFHQGFDIYYNPKLDFSVPLAETYESASRINESAKRFLQKRGHRPLFLYLHYLDVHAPYTPPESVIQGLVGKIDPIRETQLRRASAYKKEEKDRLMALYDAEIRYTDHYLEKMFQALEENGIHRDNSIILLTADHGEEFYDHGAFGHAQGLHNELIHVPLILSVPGQKNRGRVVQSPVQLIDLAPTILDLVSIDWKKYGQFQGRSFRSWLEEGTETPKEIFSGGFFDRIATIQDDWKFYTYRNQSRTVEELYNLTSDPREKVNLIAHEKERAGKLRKNSMAVLKHFSGKEAESIELDPETREELKALGYIN